MLRRSSVTSRSAMSTPSSRIRPDVGSMRRLTILSEVVLPHPDGPTRTQIFPAGTVQREVVDRARRPGAGATGVVGLADVVELDRRGAWGRDGCGHGRALLRLPEGYAIRRAAPSRRPARRGPRRFDPGGRRGFPLGQAPSTSGFTSPTSRSSVSMSNGVGHLGDQPVEADRRVLPEPRRHLLHRAEQRPRFLERLLVAQAVVGHRGDPDALGLGRVVADDHPEVDRAGDLRLVAAHGRAVLAEDAIQLPDLVGRPERVPAVAVAGDGAQGLLAPGAADHHRDLAQGQRVVAELREGVVAALGARDRVARPAARSSPPRTRPSSRVAGRSRSRSRCRGPCARARTRRRRCPGPRARR